MTSTIRHPSALSEVSGSPSPHTARSTQNRFAYIDALRGLAALYVVFYHLALMPKPNLSVPYWIKPFVLSGGTGVTLFFVVSAFTLCHSMRIHVGEPHSIQAYYLRRFFRVAPLFYVWIGISLIRDWNWFGVAHSLGKILLNVLFGYNFIPGQESGFVWASWTLGIEMVFYAVFPLIFRYVTDYRRATGFFLASLVVASVYRYWVMALPLPEAQRVSFLQYSFLHMLPVFACGILAFFVYERFVQERTIYRGWAWVLLAGAFFGYSALLAGDLNVLIESLYWQAIIYSCLLLGLAIFPWNLLVNRWTLFYGAISYSVYLNHPSIVYVLSPAYQWIYALDAPLTFKYGLSAIVTVALVTLTSYITYRAVEQPGMRLGQRLVRQFSNSTTIENAQK